MLVGALIDAGGFTTNWRWLSDVEDALGVIFSVLMFGGLWLLRRSRPRGSTLYNLPAALLTGWLAIAIPMAFFGLIWIVD